MKESNMPAGNSSIIQLLLKICKCTIGAKRIKTTDCDLSDAAVWKETPDKKTRGLGHKIFVVVF